MPTDRDRIKKESTVYAEVLLEAATAQNRVFQTSGQLEQVLHVVRGNIELRTTLADHTIDASTRSAIVREIFEGFDPALLSILTVLVERNSIALLSRINEAYLSQAEVALNAVFIDVTTVVSLDDALREQIKAKYSAQFGKDVWLREHIDPSIVGGVILSTHSRRIDASVVSQLESARAVLSTVSSGGDR